MWKREVIIPSLCVGIACNAAFFWLVNPVLMLIMPKAHILLYNFIVTALLFLLFVGLVFGAWQGLKNAFYLLAKAEFRGELGEGWRRWPTTKKDILPLIVGIWVVAIFVGLLVLVAVAPRAPMAELVDAGVIFPVLFLGIAPLFFLQLLYIYEFSRGFFRQWRGESSKGKITLAASIIFPIVALVVVWTGEAAGWDHLLWFHEE